MDKESEDILLRGLILSCSSKCDKSVIDDQPTIFSLKYTISLISKKNPDWRKNNYLISIFVWQSSLFLESHVKEICEQECPELLGLCQEYRTNKTIYGCELADDFSYKAFQFIVSEPKNETYIKFETYPVRSSFFILTNPAESQNINQINL